MKVAGTESYGARVVLHGQHLADAVRHAEALRDREGFILIPGADDPDVIAGQGTVGVELLAQVPGVEIVVVPVGGGSLASGVGSYLKAKKPSVRIVGVQNIAMPAALRSREAGAPVAVPPLPHLAEGIGVARPGDLTFRIMERVVDDLVAVTDDEIAAAIQYLAERKKVIAEGAGAAPLAALMHGKVVIQGRTAVAVVSGGNIDPTQLKKVINRQLSKAGRYVEFTATILDRPGNLARLLETLAPFRLNLVTVDHQREGADIGVEQVRVRIVAETRSREHAEQAHAALREKGYV
jgi:threonine dehydratase